MIFDPYVRSLHIELSNRCNARCPMCSRTGRASIEDDPAEITLEKFKQYFPPEFIQRLETIKFCGSFGDPAIAKDCIAIHKYINEINPNIGMYIHTNGGLRTRTFWKQLGAIYKNHPERVIVFHVDGLKDTNHIYRVDVNFDLVMENAKAAISTGAKCVWAFIPFMHNEHQIEIAEQEAYKMGFHKFVVKISARFEHKLVPFVFNDTRTGISKAIYPTTSPEYNVKNLLQELEKPVCAAEKRGQLYVSARGEVVPCCWYGGVYESTPAFKEELLKHSNPDLNTRSIYEILEDPLYNGAIKQSWDDQTIMSKPCYKKCTGKEMHYWKIDGELRPQKQLKEWMDE